ncbi:hypothetical protein E3N88_40182 [Mikania micrantha]|uniref:Uncharacterized protein n=1 Tax=Mikania micrantha TaxID=192012 RepID=A0A5N6LFN7_9ASTR|nr:hypothetical protein E3N88_43961 [Mikania micrantha]KAD2393205.1 hypothetical protein E3N88_40182 [Mikania micrantha]
MIGADLRGIQPGFITETSPEFKTSREPTGFSGSEHLGVKRWQDIGRMRDGRQCRRDSKPVAPSSFLCSHDRTPTHLYVSCVVARTSEMAEMISSLSLAMRLPVFAGRRRSMRSQLFVFIPVVRTHLVFLEAARC